MCSNRNTHSLCLLQLSEICQSCTSYFSDQNGSDSTGKEEGRFLSETCEVYAFGSNSSSQLAMGSTEKFMKASLMSHMANVQVVCTVFSFSRVHEMRTLLISSKLQGTPV